MEPDSKPVVGVVGPCASGKSTLVSRLLACGINARHISQEHSYVPYMWQRITNPDILIFLEVSYPVTLLRRQLNWTVDEYEEELLRLSHAKANAALVLDTDCLTPEEIFNQVLFIINYTFPNHPK